MHFTMGGPVVIAWLPKSFRMDDARFCLVMRLARSPKRRRGFKLLRYMQSFPIMD